MVANSVSKGQNTHANKVIQIELQKDGFHCDRLLRAQHEEVRCLSIFATLAVPIARVQRRRQFVALECVRQSELCAKRK